MRQQSRREVPAASSCRGMLTVSPVYIVVILTGRGIRLFAARRVSACSSGVRSRCLVAPGLTPAGPRPACGCLARGSRSRGGQARDFEGNVRSWRHQRDGMKADELTRRKELEREHAQLKAIAADQAPRGAGAEADRDLWYMLTQIYDNDRAATTSSVTAQDLHRARAGALGWYHRACASRSLAGRSRHTSMEDWSGRGVETSAPPRTRSSPGHAGSREYLGASHDR
jgi:hypothetical protein